MSLTLKLCSWTKVFGPAVLEETSPLNKMSFYCDNFMNDGVEDDREFYCKKKQQNLILAIFIVKETKYKETAQNIC